MDYFDKIIDGEELAYQKEVKLAKKVAKLKSKGKELILAIIVFRVDKAGQLYSRLKQEMGERVGIQVKIYIVETNEQAKALVKKLSGNQKLGGIVVQYPGGQLVKKLEVDWEGIVSLIDKKKDVDGLRKDSKYQQATVKAVGEILPLRSGNIVVVGAKGFVGKRLVEYLKKKGHKVRAIDIGDDLVTECSKADLLISATGQANLIGPKCIKKGAVVIDVGWPRGEVQLEKVVKKVRAITPVPGGVGPLTVVSLLENLIQASYTIN